jgi:hypothetical protein
MSHSGAFDIPALPSDNIPIDLVRDMGHQVSVMDDGSADALGLNLLINPSRVGGGPTTPNGSTQQQQRPAMDLSSGDMGLSGLDDIPNIDVIDVAGGGGGNDFSSMPMDSIPTSPFPAPPPSNSNPFSSPQSQWQQPSSTPFQQPQQQQQQQPSRLSPEQEEREKREELRKIEKLERRSGLRATKLYSVSDPLTAIRAERESLSDTISCERAVRQQRKLLTAFTTIVESLNNKLDPFDVDLDGWSESIDTNIEDFDDVFEELYEKYKGKGNLPPEIKLMFGVGMSGAVFHMSKVMASNPQRGSNGGLMNFMGMMANQGMPGATQAAAAFAQQQQLPQTGGQQPDPQMMPNGSGPFNLSSRGMGQPVQAMGQMEYPPSIPQTQAAPPPAQRTARREMKGPGNIADEVMQNYARMSEVRSMDGEQMAPSGYQGISSASNTAVEMLPGNPVTSNAFDSTSLPSDDIRTVDDMSTVSGRPRRRPRRPAAPVGATLSLNV